MSTPTSDDSLLERIDRGLASVEAFVVVVDLAIMVGLATMNLILHKLFDAGFDWADIIVRQMVLWLGFAGGALATYEGRHIAIDAVGKFLPPKMAGASRVLTSVGALVLTGFMFVASIDFVKAEQADGTKLFGEVLAWPFELIIPASFAAMGFHFFVAGYKGVLVALGRRAPPAEFDELDHKHGEEEVGS